MTKAIEQALNLPRLEDALKEFSESVQQAEQVSEEVDQMAAALSKVNPSDFAEKDVEGVDTHEKEMNEVYDQALTAHKQILDMGFNMEPRFAGTIMEPAARFLDIALSASKSKSEQKLKALKLRMDKQKLDFDLKKDVEEGVIDAVNPTGFIASRNDLLKDLVGKLRDSKTKNKS